MSIPVPPPSPSLPPFQSASGEVNVAVVRTAPSNVGKFRAKLARTSWVLIAGVLVFVICTVRVPDVVLMGVYVSVPVQLIVAGGVVQKIVTASAWIGSATIIVTLARRTTRIALSCLILSLTS
jgi:hypothetical protein